MFAWRQTLGSCLAIGGSSFKGGFRFVRTSFNDGSRLSEPGNQEEKKCSSEAEQTVTTEESSSENVESCVQNEPSLMGSDGPGAGATGETGKLDLDKVSS